MGFMAGFGEGFSSAYKNAAQIRASKEQDYFRVAYQEYSNKKSQYEADEAKWKDSITRGQAIAQKYGASPEAALKAAEWINAGYSEEHTEELVAKTVFSSTVNKPTQASDQNNIDTQMAGAGLTQDPVGTIESPVGQEMTAPQQDTGVLGNVLGPGGIFGESPFGQSDAAQANQQVMEAGGISQAQFDQTMGGFTPPDTSHISMAPKEALTVLNPFEEFGIDLGQPLTEGKITLIDASAKDWAKSDNPDAKAKAERWAALRPTAESLVEMDPVAQAKLLEIIDTDTRKRMADISIRKGAAQSFNSEARQLEELAYSTDGKVLTQVNEFNAMLESLKTEAGAALDLLSEYIGRDNSEAMAVASFTKSLEKAGAIDSTNKELARRQREYAARLVRMIYQLGRATGQTGNAFSNRDFDNFKDALVNSGGDLISFSRTLRNISKSTMEGIDFDVTRLMDSPSISVAKTIPFLNRHIAPSLLKTTEMEDFAPDYEWLGQEQELEDQLAAKDEETLTKGHPVGTVVTQQDGQQFVFVGGDWYNKNNFKPYNGTSR